MKLVRRRHQSNLFRLGAIRRNVLIWMKSQPADERINYRNK